jgi:hypothetical protein
MIPNKISLLPYIGSKGDIFLLQKYTLLERMKVKHLPHRLQQVSKYFCDKEREKK